MTRDEDTLNDIAEAARRIGRFLAGVAFEQLMADEEKQAAVFAQIVLIGEAAGRLSDGFRGRHVDVPWRQIVATRNRILHGYDDIDWQILWRVVTVEVPQLLARVQAILDMGSK